MGANEAGKSTLIGVLTQGLKKLEVILSFFDLFHEFVKNVPTKEPH